MAHCHYVTEICVKSDPSLQCESGDVSWSSCDFRWYLRPRVLPPAAAAAAAAMVANSNQESVAMSTTGCYAAPPSHPRLLSRKVTWSAIFWRNSSLNLRLTSRAALGPTDVTCIAVHNSAEPNWFYWAHLQPWGAELLNKLYNNTMITHSHGSARVL